MPPVLVTGATGNVGRHVVSQLTAAGVSLRALARDPASAGFPPEIDVVRGDLTVPETLDACLRGTDAVFLVWTAPPAAFPAALERIARHARRIVFLSAPLKTAHPLFQQPNPLAEATARIERLIEASGLEWTFLRPGMFACNALRWWAPQMRAGDLVRWPCLAAPTAPIDERDIAAVVVRALCGDGHAGADYVLTGPESLTQREQILTIARAAGRSPRIEEIPLEEARREGLPHMPAAISNMLLNAWNAAIGLPAFVTSEVEQLTGRPASSFLEWARDHAARFAAAPGEEPRA